MPRSFSSRVNQLSIDIAIIGAGPYGLSVASYLRANGIDFRIFGRPMHSWQAHMPVGMYLKSEGFASNLSDPSGSFTLEKFYSDCGLPYAERAAAIPLDRFLAYGLAFQKHYVPEVDERAVVAVRRRANSFEITMEDGEILIAGRILMAIGLYPFRHMPAALAPLPPELVSHSTDHGELQRFRSRDVTVIGGGSSAAELAVLLQECGANVRLVTRHVGALHYQPPPIPRPTWRRALRPLSGIGYGWHSLLIAEAPQLFRLLPPQLRLLLAQRYLMPSPGWFVRDRFEQHVEHLAGYSVESAVVEGSQVELRLRDSEARGRLLRSDHVIAATGYRLDLDRLSILDEELRRGVARVGGAPQLSAHFESSVPGLHFLGALSANCFGPAMRFVLGAEFTATRLRRYLDRRFSRTSSVGVTPMFAE
jgi:hypothetical protein